MMSDDDHPESLLRAEQQQQEQEQQPRKRPAPPSPAPGSAAPSEIAAVEVAIAAVQEDAVMNVAVERDPSTSMGRSVVDYSTREELREAMLDWKAATAAQDGDGNKNEDDDDEEEFQNILRLIAEGEPVQTVRVCGFVRHLTFYIHCIDSCQANETFAT
jgi:hypothetical protein